MAAAQRHSTRCLGLADRILQRAANNIDSTSSGSCRLYGRPQIETLSIGNVLPLLAPLLLPDSVDKILYLDPDILVINAVRPLWETALDGCAFAAASHSIVPDMVDDVNRMRLRTDHAYFNTGVILMDLNLARRLVSTDDIFQHVREHSAELLLPDQDVFNSLYGIFTKQVDDVVWNYDARRFSAYKLASGGKYSMDWVMENVAVLHFCGTQKPWKPSHSSRFSALYKHYISLAKR